MGYVKDFGRFYSIYREKEKKKRILEESNEKLGTGFGQAAV
jgi:hypothetical protein